MKRLVLPLLALSLALAGCGSSEPIQNEAAEAPSPRVLQPTPAPTPTPTPTVDDLIFEVGEPAVQGGVEMTVISATASPTISLNESGYRSGSGSETYTDAPAQAGGHYVVVSTSVKNTGKGSMDLTCGWPIEVVLFDEEERAFDPIDSLYQIKDNPECNAKLQPGFASAMTYGFLVPDDAKIIALALRDTEAAYEANPAFVRLVLP